MIFVTLGSQKFQFNRLLIEIDKLIERGIISSNLFAQIGYSDYKPKYFKYNTFLNQSDFQKYMRKCNLVITHAGTGAIISALKNNKKVIAVPRLSKYHEHVDDHQVQIVEEFSKANLVEACYNVNNLEDSLKKAKLKEYTQFRSNTNQIIGFLEKYIEEI